MRRLLSAQFLWLATRLGGAAAGLLFQIFLARILSPSDLGVFFAASSLAAVLGIVATQGYPSISVRFVSRYAERGKALWLSHFLSWARREILSVATGVAGLVMAGALIWPGLAWDTRLAFVYAGFCIPAMASLTALAALGIAQRRFVAALLPDLLARPMVLALFAGSILGLHLQLSASQAVLGFVVVTASIALLQIRVVGLAPILPRAVTRLARYWRREAWTLLAVMLFTSFFADLAIVSAAPFLATADLAAFALCIKIAMIVGFGVQIAHQILLPDLSDAYARRRLSDTTPVLLKGAPFPILFSAFALLGTVMFGKSILSFYGPQFEYAEGPLVLLVSGQLLRALGGPSQHVLTLEGQQRTNLAICIAACLLLVAGNAVLSKSFGLWGAAIGVTASYCLWVLASCAALFRGGVQTDLVSVMIKTALRSSDRHVRI
jgi:O-antigen/teichoic acid export membrane protein